MSEPVVAIAGRPNVGKSELFNRLVGRRTAIVENTPGVTRDRLYAPCRWRDRRFLLADTGGIDPRDPDVLRQHVRRQAEQALEEADLVLLVVDAREGCHPLDEEVAELLRPRGKPVLLVANKVETEEVEAAASEFYRLGLGEPLPVSAAHGLGTGDLLDRILEHLPESALQEGVGEIRVAIVGRPNVGKSSLLNRILGSDRSVVHEAAGTTRDAVDTPFSWRGRPLRLVDTAGLRRKAKVEQDVEYYSAVRALRALRRADVALLVLDAREGVVAQDQRIAGEVLQAGKASVILVNKWDLVRERGTPEQVASWRREFLEVLSRQLDHISYSPVLYVSALTGEGVPEILDTACEVAEERKRRVDTGVLNRVIREAVALRPPPGYQGRRLKVRYVTQNRVAPPRFLFRVNSPRLIHFSYRRYLENQLREAFGFVGSPIELKFVK